jgi:hypothetical protein
MGTWRLPLILLLAAAVFTVGINWGLPSRADDSFLLGKDGHGNRLEALTARVPDVDSSHGADVVAPTGPADQVVWLNQTDADKARILCRYRLYSTQPDEMITLRSLAQMKPRDGDFDPRLYQYGGLWIYAVGAIIEAGRIAGLIHLGDRAFFIAHPDAFGRLYIAARAYSAAWGVIGVWAVYAVIRRIGGGTIAPALGAICFVLMPVVVNAAHEAKPHLAGVVLILLAVLAGDHFIQNGKKCWAVLTGCACGAAMGMVLWGMVAVIVIAAMAWRKALGKARRHEGTEARREMPKAIIIPMCAAIAVYAITNPYVIYHLLFSPSVLRENLGNTAAMYGTGRPDEAIASAIKLILFGAGPAVVLGGLVGILSLRRANAGVLLAAVAMVAAIQFVATAAGKPGEYGRFGLLPDTALLVAAFSFVARRSAAWSIILLLATAPVGLLYVGGFWMEAANRDHSSRHLAAMMLADELSTRLGQASCYHAASEAAPDQPTLAVYADPAPYCLPPVDLDGWKIIRLPKDYLGLPPADVTVRPVDSPEGIFWTPLSWANKKFEVQKTPSLLLLTP